MGIHGKAHRSCGIQRLHRLHMLFQPLEHGGVRLVFHLVSHPPEQNAGMVSVPLHHAGKVLLPLRFIESSVGAARPFVKGLLIDIEAKFVAQLQHFRQIQMMGQTDGVAADLLQGKQALPPQLLRDSGAEAADILMDADALQLHGLSVDKKSPVRSHLHAAKTHRNGHLVRDVRRVRAILLSGCIFRQKLQGEFIQLRVPVAPGLNIRHTQGENAFSFGLRKNGRQGGRAGRSFCFLPCILCSGIPASLPQQGAHPAFTARIHGKQGGLPGSLFFRSVFQSGFHANLLPLQMPFRQTFQPYASVDAGSRIPPVHRSRGVVHLHQNLIFSVRKRFRHVQRERAVAVFSASHVSSVYRHPAVFIHPVKTQAVNRFRLLFQMQRAPIPAGSPALKKALSFSLLHVPVKGTGNHPVMGQRHLRKQKSLFFHSRSLQRELPVLIQT